MRTITIGRSNNNDIIINKPDVSSSHAIITIQNSGEIILKDLNSTNGTYVNGEKITEIRINRKDKVQVSNSEINWENFVYHSSLVSPKPVQKKDVITIGRSPANTIIVPQSDVSLFHATISKTDNGPIILQDNKSTNGTYVNGQKVEEHQLISGDKVLLANKYLINWEYFFYKQKNGKPINPKRQNTWGWIISIAVVVLALISFKPISTYISSKLTVIDVNEKYKNSVVLVYHSFVFVVSDGKNEYYFTKDGNGFIPFENGKTGPIQITGTGFFVSNVGELITNRHVVLPWEYSEEKGTLEHKIKEYFQLMAVNSSPDQQYQIYELLKNMSIYGRTLNIGIALNDTYISSTSDFIPCQLIRESEDSKIDIALLQTKEKTLPSKVTNIINLDEAITDEKQLKSGEELHMIGYPAGFNLAATKKGIMVNFQNGQITRLSDGIDFGHNIPSIGGASGSPIFDKKGDLVGINYQGLTQTQGFNMAMLAKYALKLWKNQ